LVIAVYLQTALVLVGVLIVLHAVASRDRFLGSLGVAVVMLNLIGMGR
jgi:hypothetical protein